MIGAGVNWFRTWFSMAPSGSEVVVFEAMDAFLPMADKALAKNIKILKKQGLDIRIGAKDFWC